MDPKLPSPYFIRRNVPQPGDEEPFVVEEAMPPRDDETPLFWEYWRVLRKHKWLIAACALVGGAALGLYSYTRTPLYSAASTIMVEKDPAQFLDMRDGYRDSGQSYPGNFYATQSAILRSSGLVAKAIRESGLENDPLFTGAGGAEKSSGFFANLAAGIKERLEGVPWVAAVRRELARLEPEAQEAVQQPAALHNNELGVRSSLVQRYKRGLTVSPVRNTSLIEISFTSTSPVLAAKLANIQAETFQRYGMDLREQANREAMIFLEQKLVELKERVEQSEAALNAYRRQKGIISLDDKGNLTVDRLADLNARLTEAEARRIALESEVKAIRNRNYDAIPRIRQSPVISGLKSELGTLEGQYANMAAEFKPGYPPLDALREQIDETRRRLRREVQSEITAIDAAYRTAKVHEDQLRNRMEQQKQETLDLKDAGVEYVYLSREVDTNRQLYDAVLQRMKEIGVAGQVRQSNVSIIEKAEVPAHPFHPNPPRSLVIGLLLGLGGGVGLAFFLDHLDTTLKTPDEVERYVNLPTLAVVPDFLKLKNRKNGYLPYTANSANAEKPWSWHRQNGEWETNGHHKELVLAHHPHSVIAESYRHLRTAILLSRSGAAPRTILFTSASRGDGKTATSVNTSIIFAQMGYKVVVIDADMRRSRGHHVLEIAKDAGLSEILTGQRTETDVIVPTTTENLFFLSSGAEPPNPAELVGSRKMKQLLEDLSTEYDFIVIDSPPVMPVSDPMLLSTMVDGVVIVVDSHKTPKKVVREVRSRLSSVNANLIGVVLNKVNWRHGDYSDHYKHYYSYYHGS